MRHSTKRFDQRGVAMLLVLISLATASVLTMSYVAARDNSASIGENVVDSAAARWAADSGLELGLAILQTEADWRNEHSLGRLVDGYSFGDGTLAIDLVDLQTGGAPTATTEYLQVTSRAVIDGLEQQASAVVYVPLDRGIDLDLSEFAAFGAERIDLSGDATITRWPRAALSVLGQPIAIGTRSTSAGSVTLNNDAAIIDGWLYTPPGASSTLFTSWNGKTVEQVELQDAIPMPLSPQTGVTDPADLSAAEKLLHLAMNIVGGTGLINTTTRVSTASLSGGAVRTFRGPMTFTSNDDLMLQNAKILIEGNVKIVVFDDVDLQNASIELKPGATLLMHIGDAVQLTDSYIGNVRSDALRDNTGGASPMDPASVRLFRVQQYSSDTIWRLTSNSVLKGTMYACSSRVEVRDQSAIYGCVAAQQIGLSEQGAIFYDPGLNTHSGYSEPTSLVYEADGTLKAAVDSITTLDEASLKSVADACDILVRSALTDAVIEPTGYTDTPPDLGEPAEPTPRPVEITYEITSFGSDITAWEHSGG